MFYITFAVFVCITITPSHGATKQDYLNLHNDTFYNYNNEVRPINDDSQPLVIYASFSLISINELQVKDQVLVSFGYVNLFWEDQFIGWNPANYGNIFEMVVSQKRIWKPDLVVGNSVENVKKLGLDEMPVRLYSHGGIAWAPSILFKTSCDINIKYYPFDEQHCAIRLETMVSDIGELDLNVGNGTDKDEMLFDYTPNGQWDLVGIHMEKIDSIFKANLNIMLTIRRNRTFYIMNIVIPIFCLAFLGAMVFALPAESGEKISLAVTILLAHVVFLTVVSDSMPQTSLQVSVLAVYLSILVCLSGFSVILSIAILRIYHRDVHDPIPRSIELMMRWRFKAKRNRPIHNSVRPKSTEASTQNQIYVGEDIVIITWKDVSKALDSVCFWSYVVITVLSTIICFDIMTKQ